ncbi:MAG: DUF5343 domain-containing protein [Muribaculaceae bacterium]|nr:DUF5343 domain-containing protein [Muribaculaceae bacterium]
MLDENGVPTSRYHQFLDQSETGKVLAAGIQEAYKDLFDLRKDANNLSIDEIKGKLKTLTQGQKSEDVITNMANTFKALCDIADWTVNPSAINISNPTETASNNQILENTEINEQSNKSERRMNLHYNIQIHLPETTNMAVYDAIFQSLKKHLI